MEGIDPDTGERFEIPKILNCVESFMPRNWSVFEFISLSFLFLELIFLALGFPLRFFVYTFFFWRLAYNLGIGLILDYQSKHKSLSRWYSKHIDEPSTLGRFLRHLTLAGQPNYDIKAHPKALSCWLAFTHLENLILGTDAFCYGVLFLKCLPKRGFVFDASWDNLLWDVFGIMLCALNWFTKKDAHRVVGAYAWYWGDFFFLANQKLVFNGVYLMFPHPMYTFGYSFFYGISMITHSYTFFFTSLLAHACQMFFLYQFEDPHIQRIYPCEHNPPPPPQLPKLTPGNPLWGLQHGSHKEAWGEVDLPQWVIVWVQWGVRKVRACKGRKEEEEGEKIPEWLRSLSPFPGIAFVGVTASLVHSLFLAVGPTPAWLTVLHALLWAAIHNGYTLGLALYMQSKRILRQVRQNCAVASPCPSPPCEGESEGECESDEVVEPLSEVYLPSSLHRFSRWQRLYRYTSFMAVLSFAVSAWRLSGARLVASWVRWGGMKIFGVALIVFAAYTAVLVYRKIGRYGWYYGDFFFLPRQGLAPLRYDGIYRYFNHPLATTGCAWMYGLAALTISPHICLLAMACHLLVWVRLFFTERTHLLALYGTPCLRSHGGLAQGVQESLKRAVDEAARLVEKAKAGWEEIETGMQRRRERRRLSASAPAE
eukprot:gnl/Trimastix_PCT/1766.p1 GENE.gnl/Trimastix_PCT/1766~~gnl/Trimastix_PCT/1766.p1  ORF type:complete len:652 (+),score=136.18 gnl/Trimastix_PCT/1766:52-2007(+)